MTSSLMDSIVAEPLSGIAFVQDYVELHFNGQIVRALTAPVLKFEGKEYKFPEDGSRDALCKLIGQTVDRVTIDDESHISIEFSNSAEIDISLDPKDKNGPESAHFVPGYNKPIAVW